MNGSRKHVLVLSSGGVDSTGCIQFFKKLKFEVEAIFFDYGQPAKKYELKAITASNIITSLYILLRLNLTNLFLTG
jgi:7-cyano-7-deazaguanine synthase